MITEDKLRIFQQSGGDVDGWVRVGSEAEKRIVSDADWSEIEELRHRLWLQQHHPASADFVKRTEQLIAAKVANEHAIKLLRELASPDEAANRGK